MRGALSRLPAPMLLPLVFHGCANWVPFGTGAAGAGAILPDCQSWTRSSTDTRPPETGHGHSNGRARYYSTLPFLRIIGNADMRCNRLSEIAAVVSLAFQWGARNGIASGRRILTYLGGPAPNGPTLTELPPARPVCMLPPPAPSNPPSSTVCNGTGAFSNTHTHTHINRESREAPRSTSTPPPPASPLAMETPHQA